MKKHVTWIADDGEQFDDEKECRDYERALELEQQVQRHIKSIEDDIQTFLIGAYADNTERFQSQIANAVRRWERFRIAKKEIVPESVPEAAE